MACLSGRSSSRGSSGSSRSGSGRSRSGTGSGRSGTTTSLSGDRDIAALQQLLALRVARACGDFIRGRFSILRHHGLWGWHVIISHGGMLSLVTGLWGWDVHDH